MTRKAKPPKKPRADYGPSWRPELAPDELGLVHALLITRNTATKLDEIAGADALRDSLAGRGLLPADTPIDDADARFFRDLRDGLRSLVTADPNGDERLDRLTETLVGVRFRFDLGEDGRPRLRPVPGDEGLAGVVTRLLDAVCVALHDGTWRRFKRCRNPQCGWIYYDASKQTQRRWCLTARCGNRKHVVATRRRHGRSVG